MFQTGSEERGLTHGGVFHVQVAADGAGDHFAGVEADAQLDADGVRAVELFRILAQGPLHG